MNGNQEVVVITGASAGVGRAVVREFARRSPGVRIGLLARNPDGLEGAREEVEAAGGKALVIQTDVADAEAVDDAARRVEEELGPIDVWINNAMTAVFAPLKDVEPDEFKRVTEVTYLGCVHGTMAAVKRMLPARQGNHPPGRVRPGLPGHPAPVRLLRGQARHKRLYRVRARRAYTRAEQRPSGHGPPAGG